MRILVLLISLLFGLIMPSFAQYPLEGVRRSQYAGTWYEADGAKLERQLHDYLRQAQSDPSLVRDILEHGAKTAGSKHENPAQTEVLALIAPHAGYIYSGKTAAYSYEAAQTRTVKRVFVLGPSHHVALHGVALPLAMSFETPLGNLEVDKDIIEQLTTYPLFSVQPGIHLVEHSLEMQLPFIRQTFGNVKIVPLVVGTLNDESEVRLVAEVLKGYVAKDDIIVVSSDFTHYGPRYDYQPFKTNMQANIEKLDHEAFDHLAHADVSGFLSFQARTNDTICGLYPCAILCAMMPHGARARLLKYATSQEVAIDDRDNSVSYLAIAFTGPHWPDNPSRRKSAADAVNLSDSDKQALLTIARKSLTHYVKHEEPINPEACGISISPAMRQCFGAFVTLYTSAHEQNNAATTQRILHPHRDLRGCIGNIWPVKPLYQTVADNAIAACSRDYRFAPVKPEELKNIEIEISVLTPPRRVESYKDIKLGTDGIIVSKDDHQAVFLPLVATEFGWDLDETLRQLSMKAGLGPDGWRDGAKFDLFQSISIEEK